MPPEARLDVEVLGTFLRRQLFEDCHDFIVVQCDEANEIVGLAGIRGLFEKANAAIGVIDLAHTTHLQRIQKFIQTSGVAWFIQTSV